MTSQRISSPLYQTKWMSVLRQNTLLEAAASLLTGEEHGRPVPGRSAGRPCVARDDAGIGLPADRDIQRGRLVKFGFNVDF